MLEFLNGLSIGEYTGWLLVLLIVIALWKLIWYGLALYKTIEKKQKSWFVVLFAAAFLLNDLGILAIIYLWIIRERVKIKKKK